MNRIELRLAEDTLVHRDDGLLDRIELHTNGVAVVLIIGPAGAYAAAETGAHLLAAARRQHVPETDQAPSKRS
jgi:hypothetical protein